MSENTNYCDHPTGDCVMGKDLIRHGYELAIKALSEHKCRVLMLPFEKCGCPENITAVAEWLKKNTKENV